MRVQRMLKMNRFYTLAGILNKIFVKKKTKDNWGPYLRTWFDKLRFGANLIFITVYYAITACTTDTFTFVKC